MLCQISMLDDLFHRNILIPCCYTIYLAGLATLSFIPLFLGFSGIGWTKLKHRWDCGDGLNSCVFILVENVA